MAIFSNLPSGESRTRVECCISIRELYFRRTATSGPATVLLSPGCALTKTACAQATLGVRAAIAHMMRTAAAQQDVNLTLPQRITISPGIKSAYHPAAGFWIAQGGIRRFLQYCLSGLVIYLLRTLCHKRRNCRTSAGQFKDTAVPLRGQRLGFCRGHICR